MSDKPFRNEVYIVDPSFLDAFNDIKETVSELEKAVVALNRIANLNGLNMEVPSDEEVD
uniref:Uncharacterized protein n=1 Tax=viral metagenome TaxID=1070528 RepID=A0A6M3LH40_9ZZZZ